MTGGFENVQDGFPGNRSFHAAAAARLEPGGGHAVRVSAFIAANLPCLPLPAGFSVQQQARFFALSLLNGHLRKFLFLLAVFSVSWGISAAANAQRSTLCEGQANDNLKADCEALEALYDATGGADWSDNTGWKTDSTLNNWKGVTVESVNSAEDRVTRVFLNDNYLTGTMPAKLNDLTSLKQLWLYGNSISGTIPTLSALTSLTELKLKSNSISGTIPDLSALTSLEQLWLNGNSISGTIPTLSALTSLRELVLDNNMISGTIPDLSALTSLEQMDIPRNRITGTIKAEYLPNSLTRLGLARNMISGEIPDLSALTSLTQLNLYQNRITGTITASHLPTSLIWVVLDNNRISGPMPDLSALVKLEQLWLQINMISGTIPDLSALTELVQLNLGGNRISGPIPDLSALTKLSKLYLTSNRIGGTITASHFPTSLIDLGLDENRISGTIPDLSALDSVSGLYLQSNNLGGIITASHFPASLQYLWLYSNSISGTIPDLRDELPNLISLYLYSNSISGTVTGSHFPTSLRILWLHRNSLDGPIPDLSDLTSLSQLALSYNSISGTITASHFPASLRYLYLNANSINGTIPDLSTDLAGLIYLYLHTNSLGGTITASHFPASLYRLYLNRNNLSGTIPSELGNLTSLRHLYLSDNDLTGEMPSELGNLTSLQHLYLSDNDLAGEMPSDLGNLTSLQHLYLHNNKLTDSGNNGLSPDLDQLASLQELSLWGNTDPTGDVDLNGNVTSSVIDRAALRVLHDTNGGLDWKTRTGWRSSTALGTWYGVTTDATSGRVSSLDLADNGLKNEISNSLEALSGLTSLDLSNNKPLSGTLAERLKDISGLATLNIRCTAISTPSSDDFSDWLSNKVGNLTSFLSGCPSAAPPPAPPPPPPAPEPPTPVSPEGSVLIAESGDDGFAFTPVGAGGRVVYGTETIEFTVTGNDGPNPTIILSRTALSAIGDAGGSVSFDVSSDLSEDPPSGFRLGGLVADIGLGVDDAGDTVGVCLPVDEGAENPVVHHYDEESGTWEPLAEQKTSRLNGVRSVCGKTDAFARFGLFVAEEDPVPPPAVGESGGGCAVAGAGSRSVIPTADLLSAGLLLLAAVSFRRRALRRQRKRS